ncbi:hypothetical protein H4219_004431 [Mycoemilia scoparia]|uniref:Uncharacterized protein n=1 Tax=Mycoemilia scoparia TaxID=417184 RepID=A0A9W7ZXI0_9FUNG|nr:hypothetical protein H4219_004431 [Mycoemilia scoparia]
MKAASSWTRSGQRKNSSPASPAVKLRLKTGNVRRYREANELGAALDSLSITPSTPSHKRRTSDVASSYSITTPAGSPSSSQPMLGGGRWTPKVLRRYGDLKHLYETMPQPTLHPASLRDGDIHLSPRMRQKHHPYSIPQRSRSFSFNGSSVQHHMRIEPPSPLFKPISIIKKRSSLSGEGSLPSMQLSMSAQYTKASLPQLTFTSRQQQSCYKPQYSLHSKCAATIPSISGQQKQQSKADDTDDYEDVLSSDSVISSTVSRSSMCGDSSGSNSSSASSSTTAISFGSPKIISSSFSARDSSFSPIPMSPLSPSHHLHHHYHSRPTSTPTPVHRQQELLCYTSPNSL